ncbi:hypothetical protein VNO77_35139 [Canavalia gladiata]|uniref:PGG domain-containing protein n=1 Tax=Canavalia gladiata TaxID=3824 RepID=A0AAN9KHG4_CANGL
MLSGIRHIYEIKKKHYLVLGILNYFRERIDSSESDLPYWSVCDALFQAAKYGIIEFINSTKAAIKLDLLWATDKNKRGILAHAVVNRQEKVFNLIREDKGHKKMLASFEDVFGNNILHLAAEFNPFSTNGDKFNAILQILREIQWFKRIPSVGRVELKYFSMSGWAEDPIVCLAFCFAYHAHGHAAATLRISTISIKATKGSSSSEGAMAMMHGRVALATSYVRSVGDMGLNTLGFVIFKTLILNHVRGACNHACVKGFSHGRKKPRKDKLIQLFLTVERIAPPNCKESKNKKGFTPRELFTISHRQAVKESQQWLKDISTISITIGTVIITLMFTAAITVPGGNDQSKGTPIFLGQGTFTFFAIADAISLIMSLLSVLTFMSILISSYSDEEIFFRRFPLKLLVGFLTLFASVSSMMCAFYAALVSLLKGYCILVTAAILLAIIPIWMLLPTLLPLFFQILKFATRFDFWLHHKEKNSW